MLDGDYVWAEYGDKVAFGVIEYLVELNKFRIGMIGGVENPGV